MSEFLTPQQIEEFRHCFEQLDVNDNGKIGMKELGSVLRCFGINPTEAEVQDIINEVDADGNGTLDFEEFVSLMCKRMTDTDVELELKNAFNIIDLDVNGRINAAELKRLFDASGAKVTDEEVEEMIREADLDGDGLIDLDEFKRVVASM